jgi:hypothetical protein
MRIHAELGDETAHAALAAQIEMTELAFDASVEPR